MSNRPKGLVDTSMRMSDIPWSIKDVIMATLNIGKTYIVIRYNTANSFTSLSLLIKIKEMAHFKYLI